MTTARAVLAVAAMKHWHVSQMDVINTFLHGDSLEEFYMLPPQGYTGQGEVIVCTQGPVLKALPSSLVCKLNKSPYGCLLYTSDAADE